MSQDVVYQIITDRMIEQLEAGTVPWRKPWGLGAGRDWPRKPGPSGPGGCQG